MDAEQGQVTLREIQESDAWYLIDWRNDPANARWFPKQKPWTLVSQQAWYYDTYLTDPSQNLYMVVRGRVPIGTVGMTIKNGCGELERMMLGDKTLARGGYMRQGMRQLMDSYGLGHYWLRVMPDNEATIAFHKKNGFSVYSKDGDWYENVNGERGQYLIMGRSGSGYWQEVPNAGS